jgi:hypothetical protein
MSKVRKLRADRSLALTSLFLILMLGGGIASAIVGYSMGHTALRGVTQPDVRPSSRPADTRGVNSATKGLQLVNEREAIARAQKAAGNDPESRARRDKEKPDSNPADKDKDKNKPQASQSSPTPSASELALPEVRLPLVRNDQGIEMVVKQVKLVGSNIQIELTLKNQGSQAVIFEPGVLTVTDSSGQSIPLEVKGLTPNLAANGKPITVMATMPRSALGADAKTIALQLTDQERKLLLDALDLPIAK